MLVSGEISQVMLVDEFRSWANDQVRKLGREMEVGPLMIESLLFKAEETEIEDLLKYFSSLGLVLFYPHLPALRDRVFVRPQEIRCLILEVLKGFNARNGYFHTEDVRKRQRKSKSTVRATEILALMQEFKMVFQIGGPESGQWIAPLYLPENPPAGVAMLLSVFGKPVRRIVYPNFIHKSVTLELFQAFSQDLMPESGQGLASERHVVWRDGMVIRFAESEEMVLVKFFIGAAAIPATTTMPAIPARQAHIEVYAFKTPAGARPAERVLMELKRINRYWHTIEEVTVDGKAFVSMKTLKAAEEKGEPYFVEDGHTYALDDFAEYVEVPPRVFISYSEADEAYCLRLEQHLSVMQSGKGMVSWHRGKLTAGMETNLVVQRELQRASIIILLVSIDYLSDRQLWEKEMSKALEKAKANQSKITFVKVKPCRTASLELARYVPLIGDVVGKPDNDRAWDEVVGALEGLIQENRKGGGV